MSMGRESIRSVLDNPEAPPAELPLAYVNRCRFLDDNRIGVGAFGEIFLCHDTQMNHKFVVMRMILWDLDERLKALVRQEMKVSWWQTVKCRAFINC